MFLIQERPSQALDIMEKYHLLSIMEVNYERELDLLLSVAHPVVYLEKSFVKLRLILQPMQEISSLARKALTKKLNQTTKTFQRVNINFLDSLQETEGFEEVDWKKGVIPYSFAELVFIYLTFHDTPNIKPKKLQKKLKKVQKDATKILRLIEGKKKINDLVAKSGSTVKVEMLRNSLKDFGARFVDIVMELFHHSSNDSLEEKLCQEFKLSHIKNVEQKASSDSFQQALLIYKNEDHKDYAHLFFDLIRAYLQNETYPNKSIFNSFPWNLAKNKAWLKQHMKTKWWAKNFTKKYPVNENDIESNVSDRISHHLFVAKKILKNLKIHVPQLSIDILRKVYKDLKKDPEVDQRLLSDLGTQVEALNALQGPGSSRMFTHVIIEPEFNPMEIIQMGNYVTGSCLSTNGINAWSTIVNAMEVNKRILWAKEQDGDIIGRLLIAVDDQNKILRFPIYYGDRDIKLDKFFNDYIIELAKKCKWGVNGDKKKVANLVAQDWYTDQTVGVDEFLTTAEEQARKAS